MNTKICEWKLSLSIEDLLMEMCIAKERASITKAALARVDQTDGSRLEEVEAEHAGSLERLATSRRTLVGAIADAAERLSCKAIRLPDGTIVSLHRPQAGAGNLLVIAASDIASPAPW